MKDLVHTLEWFQNRQGKKVFRSSKCYPNLIYLLYFPKPVMTKMLLKNKKDSLKSKREFINKLSPSIKSCEKDSLRQFHVQKEGYRFYDKKPKGMELSGFEI